MPYTKEQLQQRYNALPSDLKAAMNAVETPKRIYQIGQKYKLRIDQMGEMADEIGLVMLGLIPLPRFLGRLAGRLGVDQKTVRPLAQEISERIFAPIRDSLKKIHEEREDEELSLGLDRKEVLKEIENPPPAEESPTVFEKKLGQLFRIPREEVDLDPYREKPE